MLRSSCPTEVHVSARMVRVSLFTSLSKLAVLVIPCERRSNEKGKTSKIGNSSAIYTAAVASTTFVSRVRAITRKRGDQIQNSGTKSTRVCVYMAKRKGRRYVDN